MKDLLDSEDTGIFLFQNGESELLRKAAGFLVGILNLKHMEEQAKFEAKNWRRARLKVSKSSYSLVSPALVEKFERRKLPLSF